MPKTNPQTWSPPPGSLDLQARQVDVWRVRLDLPADGLNQLESTLSKDETERAARFHFPADRDRFTAAHGYLRDILARYLHCEPRELSFSVTQHGKPVLPEHELEFNLSHSGDFALIAIARGHRVGVDVEHIREGISSQVIARQYFSQAEFAELQSLPTRQKETAFFTCWTRKEAYIKAQGLGLSFPLESFDVSLTPNEPAILRATRPDPAEAARWTLFSLKTGPLYESAVAVEGKDLEFRLWDWNNAAGATRHG
ncbi:MAG TPA: 4'-phosphopantetheinyl transferase superfamily protein [Anaerolineales bacterium]|nr:4'-phosphopantetheinyl transferase superfamily protein [Anaerolineales bacterium]